MTIFKRKVIGKIPVCPCNDNSENGESSTVSALEQIRKSASSVIPATRPGKDKSKLIRRVIGKLPNEQVQSDWNQSDSTKPDYIKNKPTIPQGVIVDDNLSPNSTNPVQNKIVHGALINKQDKLMSGTNIKTINGQSVLGSGNIQIEGGGGDSYTKQESDAKYQPKVAGKGLSTNDYTNEDKEKVAAALTEHQDISGKADKTSLQAEVTRATNAEENLRQLYNNLQQSQPVPVTALPATGEAGKIYRLAGTTSYADYMYSESDLTTPIKMAEYNNAIDNAPTAGSGNLVTSGGVFVNMKELKQDVVASTNFYWQHYGLNNGNPNLQLDISAQSWLDSGWCKANLLKGITFDNTGFDNVIVVLADKSIDTSSSVVNDGLWTSFKHSIADFSPLIYSLPFEVGYYRIFFNKSGITEADIEGASLKVYYESTNSFEQYLYKDLYKIGCEKTPDNIVDGFISETGDITTNAQYKTRIYHVSPGEKVWLKGSNHATGFLYCYGLYNGVPTSNTFVSGVTIDQALGHGKSSGGQVGSLDNFIIIPKGISYIATTSYPSDGFSETLNVYSVELNINRNFAWKHFGINTSNANLQLNIPAQSWLDSGWIKTDGIESIVSNTNPNLIIFVVLASIDIDTLDSEVVDGKWLLIQKKSNYFNISRQGYGFEVGYIRICIYMADGSSISTHDADDLNIKLGYYSTSNNNDVNLFSLNWQNTGFSFDSNGFNLNISAQSWLDSGWMPICDIKAFKFNKRIKLFIILATKNADLTATSLNYDVARFQSSEGNYLELIKNNSNFEASYIRIYINATSGDNLSNKGNALGLAEIEIIRESQEILSENYNSGKELVPESTQDGYLAETGEIRNHSLYKCRIYNVENRNVVMISGTFESTPDTGVFAIYNGEVSTDNLVWCVINRELADSTQYWSGGRKITVARLITIPKGTKYLVTNSVVDETQLLVYDAIYTDVTKYIDCLGDSLTMGHTRLGWFEDELQHLAGGAYKVRNWGVGGETIATIMCRQGSAAVKFPSTFTLPANGSEVEIANGGNNTYMTSMFNGARVTPLLQGSNKEYNHRINVVNPCYINGIECTMTRYLINESGSEVNPSNIRYTIKRNNSGSRDVTFSQNTSVLFNTGKEMGKANIAIIWMGTNVGYNSFEELVEAHRIVTHTLTTNKYIVIGLHKLSKADGETYESLMYKEFGNRFFNIREYCCTNLCYDAGITPSAADIANMQAGICPDCVLQDGTHFLPASNKAIGAYLYNMMVGLGYFK